MATKKRPDEPTPEEKDAAIRFLDKRIYNHTEALIVEAEAAGIPMAALYEAIAGEIDTAFVDAPHGLAWRPQKAGPPRLKRPS
jgi:hypothetical protein